MLWNMIIVEQNKLFKRAILWVELGLLALVAVIAQLITYALVKFGDMGRQMPPEAVAQMEQSLVWPDALNGLLQLAAGSSLGGMLVIVLVGTITAQEYTWRTFQLWLSRGISRSTVMGAKFAAVIVPILLLVLTPLLVGGVVTAVFSQQLTGTIPWAEVDWALLGANTLRTAYTLLPYAALAFFLAVISRSTVVAIAGGLAYSLLLEGIVVQLLSLAGGTWTRIGMYLPAGLAHGLLSTNSGLVVTVDGDPVQAVQYLEPAAAAVGIMLYTIVLITVAVLVFRRQDLGG